MKKILGLLAVAGLLAVVAPSVPAQAVSLSTPGITAAVQDGAKVATTEVRYGRGHGHGYGRHHGMRRHHSWHRHHGWHRGRHFGRHHHRHFR